MKTRGILYVAILFLAVNIVVGSHSAAALTFELTQTSQQIRGIDSESGVAFQASLPSSDHVIIDANIGTKRIHADIDYTRQRLRVVSVSEVNGTSVTLSAQDIVAFQNLLVSLPPRINTESLHAEALTSLVNFVASAPAGNAIDISSAGPNFTNICPKIGGQDVAIYTLLKGGIQHTSVTVGPVCYMKPALGRCGAGGGPDPVIGLVQRFTQQCLNHDECCVKTKDRFIGGANVCGNSGLECVPEFRAAAPGFFFGPDCGTTAGDWSDNYGLTYALSGGDSRSTPPQAFIGTVKTSGCAIWNVKGTRTGTKIVFTATNPSGASRSCAASYTYTGAYNNCNTAMGTWSNSSGNNGMWSWKRTNTVNQTVLFSSTDAGPRPTDK